MPVANTSPEAVARRNAAFRPFPSRLVSNGTRATQARTSKSKVGKARISNTPLRQARPRSRVGAFKISFPSQRDSIVVLCPRGPAWPIQIIGQTDPHRLQLLDINREVPEGV